MIRVCVADDEPLARNGVAARLALAPDIRLLAEFGDGRSALAGVIAHRPDLVFLDVRMPGMSGLEVLAALEPPQRPLAILLTAYDSFAVQAFALNAVDYLLKPIDDERFDEALQRARDRLAANASADAQTSRKRPWAERFSVRVGHRSIYVATDDVLWIGADGDYAVLHTRSGNHLLRESLQRLSARLDPTRFVRVHRSAIVRVDQVAELQPMTNRDAVLRLHDGTPVRVSRTYIDALLECLSGAVC